MGGNVTIDGVSAEPLDIREISSTRAALVIGQLLTDISWHYTSKMYSDLWVGGLWIYHVSGSTAHLFNPDISMEELVKFKPVFGDIDMQIDRNKAENFVLHLKTIDLPDCSYLGHKQSGNTVVTLWNMHRLNGLKLQIDFELVDYYAGLATPWCKMMYSSDWGDVQAGFKGVAHKFLLRALNAVDLMEREIKSKRGVIKKVKSSEHAISARGLRRKLLRADGNYWEELPAKGAEYITDPVTVFKHYFVHAPSKEELEQFSSFVGLCELVWNNFTPVIKKNIYKGFVYSLTNEKAQDFCKDSEDSDLMKARMINYVRNAIGVHDY